ncbi:MAG: UbiA family prenyltransferase, partial [Candidatus Moraniibacteriota bacterium]
MQKYLLRIVEKIEDTPGSLSAWILTFTAIVLGRFGIEKLLTHFEKLSAEGFFLTLSQYFLEFLFVAILFIFIARFGSGETIRRVSWFTLFGFLLILTPPLFDLLILHAPATFTLYEFGSFQELAHHFFTFFDDTPEIGITYGIRIEIAIAIVILGLYSYLKKKSLLRALATSFLTYLMLYVVSTLPSWLTLLLLSGDRGWSHVTGNDAVMLFLAPTLLFGEGISLTNAAHLKMSLVYGALVPATIGLFLFLFFRPSFIALWKNARFPQLVYHAGLFLLGGVLALFYTGKNFDFDIFHLIAILDMLIAVECAWLASVIVNDFHDTKIDALTNAHRPLPAGSIPVPTYKTIGLLFFVASLLLSAIISPFASLLLALYQGLAWIYSAWPLRLKRFPIVATALAAAASLLVFYTGYTVFATDKSTESLPWQIPLFLFIVYALLLPIKDFKDIEGDRADGVITLPVLLGEAWAKRLIGGTLFLLFVSSVFVLNVSRLFILAAFFG